MEFQPLDNACGTYMLINKIIKQLKNLQNSGDYKEYFHPVTGELMYLNVNEKNNHEN